MLYVGIDQHTRQLTVCVRSEAGDVILRRTVSTQPQKVRIFCKELQQMGQNDGGFIAIVEICGFNEWLVDMLREFGCQQTIVIQPEKQSTRKTDRRDAARLSELLWINRLRLLEGRKVNGLRVVELPTAVDAENRQLTLIRKRLAQERTRAINRIKRIIHKHNLIHNVPTKTFQTKKVQKWLRQLELPTIDRLEMDLLLTQWQLTDEQLAVVQKQTEERAIEDRTAQILMSIGGCGAFTALAIASRIGRIERFSRGRSLANFFGLTPTCASSGESGDRLGHISKQGSSIVRFLLGQLVTRVLRDDADLRAWFKAVKRRRGAKIARVAVMRRLTTSMWSMIKHEQPYMTYSQRQQDQRLTFTALPPRRDENNCVTTT